MCGKPKPHKDFRRDYFRGGNAPASLKQQQPKHSLRPAGSHFRGGNAPASLKRLRPGYRAGSPRGFPGWKRPGLIEASLRRIPYSL